MTTELNNLFSEIIWWYPTDSDFNNRAVSYNYAESTGVAGGVERIILALENQNSKFKESSERISVLYVPDADMKNHAIKITSSLRDKGMFVNIDLNDKPLKKQMEQSIDSKFVVIIAPNEFSNGVVVLRNMLDRSEKQVKLEELFSELS